jgi:iron complex outermembrane receptor protein
MKTFTKKGSPVKHARRRTGEVSPAATGWAIFLMAGSGAAIAQDQGAAAETEGMEEVLVTGIRASIQQSIGVKKNESSIVEVVSAEDIGKLPDSSIAESIARLPGIAAQRTNGRAQTLSIRGLGPDFTVTTFNGREQATTNDNRTVEFDQYPSELVTQVKIFKTPDAGMAYQGIAGTTDISTVKPLAYDDRRMAITYRREQNQQDANIPGLDDAGDRVNLTYLDQFRDGTVGLAFGFAYNKTPYQAQTREPWGYADPDGNGPITDLVIGGDKSGVQSSFYERKGYLAVLEFAPTDRLRMVLDAYHSDFNELQTIQRMEFGTIWGGAALSNSGAAEDGRIQSGTFANVPFVVIENYNNDRTAEITSLGFNTKFQLNDNWSLEGDLSYSNSEREDLRLESTAGTGTNNDPSRPPLVDSISFTTLPDGRSLFTPTLNYSSYDSVFLTDPGAWGGGPRRSGFVGNPTVEDDIQAIRLAVNRKFEGFLSDVTLGVNYADRTKTKQNFQSILYLPGNVSHLVVPEDYRTGIADTSFFGSPYGMISYDAIGLYRSGFWQPIDAYVDPNPLVGNGDRQSAVTNDWEVNEKLTTVFLRFGIDTELGTLPLRGNIGVQSVTADQAADINFFSPPDPPADPDYSVTQRTLGDKYTDILPSLNLALDLPNDMKVRIGAAKTQARPRMDEMAGGASYSVVTDSATPGNENGQLIYWTRNGGGNPELRPWEANTYDLSFEKYFAEDGYVSIAGYYKDIKTFIYQQSILTSFEGVLLPDQDSPGDPTVLYTEADANRIGVSTVRVNGTGGYIQGVEVTASIPLSLFSDAMDGFGFIVSAAKNSSRIVINQVETAVPGLSDEVVNSTLYFEKHGFSARVSNRYRGDFVGEVPEFDASLSLKTVKAESLIDAQIGYEWREGPMEGLSLNLSGYNLTDEPFVLRNVDDPEKNLIKYQEYGATYSLAATYKF